MSAANTALNVVWATVSVPVFSESFCPLPSLSFQAMKFIFSSFGVGAVGSATCGLIVDFVACSQVKSFLTS